MTVLEQGLGGVADDRLFEVCSSEGRILITLDRDFGQITRFPPANSAGIVILDVTPQATLGMNHDRLRDFLTVLEENSVTGALWIVEPGRVRIHLSIDQG